MCIMMVCTGRCDLVIVLPKGYTVVSIAITWCIRYDLIALRRPLAKRPFNRVSARLLVTMVFGEAKGSR